MFRRVLFPTDFSACARVLPRDGIPFVETLRVAEEEEVCLIVLGKGRSAVAEMLAGSTFENVIRQSRRPVLVVRGGRCGGIR